MGNVKIRKMVQGAMIAAIFGALSIFNTYTGSMFDIFICYGMVIPLVWYSYTYRLQDGLLVSLIAMIVIMITGLPFFAISSFSSCLIGVFLGEALKRQASRGVLFLGTLSLTFFNNILLYEVFAGLLNMDLIAEMKEMYMMMDNVFPSITQTFPLTSFLSLAPLLLLMMSFLEMYVIILLCQMVLSRFHIPFPNSFHIAYMHLSRPIGGILTIMLVVSYVLEHIYAMNNIYITYIYLISLLTLAVEGLAFLSWLAILENKPRLIILAFLGMLIPFINQMYVVIGIVDIFSDLRTKLLYNKHNEQ